MTMYEMDQTSEISCIFQQMFVHPP